MQDQHTALSRRAFLGGTAALAATSMMPKFAAGAPLADAATKPDSNFGGVQIGTITYSFRSMPGSAEDLLKYLTQCGLSSVELMSGPAEQFAKAYPAKVEGETAPMDGFKALKKMYNDAGVNIHSIKYPSIGNPNMSDEDVDRCFEVAKSLGAKGITREMHEATAKRLGPFADKHEIMIGFHNHTQLRPDTYDGPMLSHGKYLGINLDIGHYVAGNNRSPLPLIEKYRDRILSLHIKDRKVNNGPNRPLGEGDTPVALVLQYMKRHELKFPADIELEYGIPKGSDAVQEVTKCVEFCKKVLA